MLRFGEQKEPNRISAIELLEFGFTENKEMSFPPIFDSNPEEYIVEDVNEDNYDDISNDEDDDNDIEVVEIGKRTVSTTARIIIKKVTRKIFSWIFTITFAFVLAL